MGSKEIGKRLREKRLERQLSVSELAQLCGISASFLHNLEVGRNFPSLKTFIGLIKELDADAEWVMFGTARPDKMLTRHS